MKTRLQDVRGIEVEPIAKPDFEGGIIWSFAATLFLSGDGNSQRREKLVEYRTRASATELVEWLRSRMRLPPPKDLP